MTTIPISDQPTLNLDASIDYSWLYIPIEKSKINSIDSRKALAKKWLKEEELTTKQHSPLFSFWDKTYSSDNPFHALMKNFTQMSQEINNLYCDILVGRKVCLSEVYAISKTIIKHFNEETITYAHFVKHPSTEALQTLRQTLLFLAFAVKTNLNRAAWNDMLCGIIINDLGMTSILNDLSTCELQKKTTVTNTFTLLEIKELIYFDMEVSSLTMSLVERFRQEEKEGHSNSWNRDEESSLYLKMYDMIRLYCSLTKSRKVQPAVCPLHAMKIILRQECNRGHSDLAFTFAKALGLYPVGTVVELINGKVVQISSYNEEGMYHARETSGTSNFESNPISIDATDIHRVLTVLCNEKSHSEKLPNSPVRIEVTL